MEGRGGAGFHSPTAVPAGGRRRRVAPRLAALLALGATLALGAEGPPPNPADGPAMRESPNPAGMPDPGVEVLARPTVAEALAGSAGLERWTLIRVDSADGVAAVALRDGTLRIVREGDELESFRIVAIRSDRLVLRPSRRFPAQPVREIWLLLGGGDGRHRIRRLFDRAEPTSVASGVSEPALGTPDLQGAKAAKSAKGRDRP